MLNKIMYDTLQEVPDGVSTAL